MRWSTIRWFQLPARLNLTGLLMVAVPLSALISLTLSLRVFQTEHARADAEVWHCVKVQREIQPLLTKLSVAEASIRGFLLIGQDELLGPYRSAREGILADLRHVERSFGNDPLRSPQLQRLRPLIEKKLEVLSNLRQYAALPGMAIANPPSDLISQGDLLMDQLRNLLAELRQKEDQRIESASAVAVKAQNKAEMVVLGTVLLGFSGGILGVWLLMSRIVTSERNRAQTTVQDSQEKLEQMLQRAQAQAKELATSEEELRSHKRVLESVLDSLSDGVAVIAPGGELLLSNPAAAHVLHGLDRVPVTQWAEHFGLRLEDAVTPCPLESLAVIRALCGEEVPTQTLFMARGPDSGVWIRLSGRPLLDESGRVSGAVVVFTDITLNLRHQEMLSRAKDEAEHSNHAKSEFLSRMSHELRTPLNAILGFAQLLEIARLEPLDLESVDQIVKAGRHLLTLINEVLDISRIESGKVSLSPEPVQLAELLQETLDMVQPQASQRRIRIDGRQTCGSGLSMMADRQRLKQVLLNLLSNAIKYNRMDGMVTITCQLSADARVRLMVTDTGPGIPADKIDRLFNPFERLGADQTAVEGTGIGLALSKRLVEAMGGTIGVESLPDIGSTFWFEMPCSEGQLSALDHTGGLNGESQAVDDRNGSTVLCIEDNPSNLQLIERILGSRPEIHLLTAVHGAAGLRLAQQYRPDLILLDVHLPDMDGKEILDRLKADPRTSSIAVIIVSADATARQEARLREAGATDYLTKPLDVPKFLNTIDETLQYARVP